MYSSVEILALRLVISPIAMHVHTHKQLLGRVRLLQHFILSTVYL